MIESWSRTVVGRAGRVLVAGVLVALVSGIYALGVFDSLSDGGFDDPDAESFRQLTAERETFGNRSVDVIAVYSHDELTADRPGFRNAVQRALAELPEDAVSSVVPWYAVDDPSMVSQDGRAAQVLISLAGSDQDENMAAYEDIEPLLAADPGSGLETGLAGMWAVYDDVNETVAEDLKRAELFAMPFVLLLSLLIFRSVVAALMPVLVGSVAVVGALAAVRGITELTDVSVFAINVVTLLGMGLAIDYALFIVSRFREELGREPVPDRAAAGRATARAMATAGRTVLFSGLVVAASLCSLLVFPQPFLRSIAYGGTAAVLVAMVAALTILPAVLRLLGRRIDALSLPGRRGGPVPDGQGGWARLARAVMARPVVVIVVTSVALLALAAPFLGVKWGGVDHRVLPPDAPSHAASETLATEFGEERSTANVLVEGGSPAAVQRYVARLGEVEGVESVRPVAQEQQSRLFRVTWAGNSQTEESQELVRALRDVPIPQRAEVLVGGLTATTVDMLTSIGERLVPMALIVVAIMTALLFIAFGSLVLPVKAVVMNVLSIGASFGVVTWIFSDGHLEGLLNFTSPGYLDATEPILMLAILFGLSMDYEVFLLSRVREERDAGRSNEQAVALGVQRTGRIITAAALLLGIVIGAFGTSDIVLMKMIGVGMLVALLLDATVVRALLVPATMKLLGRWNWWAPRPMVRWWFRHGFREEGHAPPPASERPQRALADAGSGL